MSLIDEAPGELLYGFNPRHAIDLSNPASPTMAPDDWAELRETIRKEAPDSITHAQGMMKIVADKRRQEFFLAVGDRAYLRFHKGYHLPGVPKAKIGQQCVGPFEVEAT